MRARLDKARADAALGADGAEARVTEALKALKTLGGLDGAEEAELQARAGGRGRTDSTSGFEAAGNGGVSAAKVKALAKSDAGL